MDCGGPVVVGVLSVGVGYLEGWIHARREVDTSRQGNVSHSCIYVLRFSSDVFL